MRRALTIAAALAAISLSAASPASAEQLVTSISRHQVMVNSSFTGTAIVLFGTIEPDGPNVRRRASEYDLVVTVTGPKQTTVARRKERVLGIWTNVDSRTFVNVPSYLAILGNRAFDQMASADMLRSLQIGFNNVLLPQQIGSDIADVVRDDPIRVNFIRLKGVQRLYLERANGVTFLTPTVFRAEIPLPAISPVGNYDVDIKLFANKAMIQRANSAFELVKVGFEQFVVTAARDYGMLYGITTAMMAMMTGWLASVIFRRD